MIFCIFKSQVIAIRDILDNLFVFVVIRTQTISLVIDQHQPEGQGGTVRAYEYGKVFRTEGDGFS